MRVADFARSETGIPWRLPVRHLSASSLIEAASCPEKFRRSKILGQKEKATASLVIGSAFHNTIAEVLDWKKRDSQVRYEDSMFEQAWEKTLAKEGGVDAIEWGNAAERVVLVEDARVRAWQLAVAYVDKVAPRLEPETIEQRFNAKLVHGLPVPLLGFIDLVTAHSLVDYKTSSRKVTAPKGTWVLQARIYQMVYARSFEWHVVVKSDTPAIWTPLEAPSLSLPYNEVAIQQTKRVVRDLAWTLNYYYLTLGESEPWPTTGYIADDCRFCAFRDSCVAWRR